MAFVKNLNGKAVIATGELEGDLMVPEAGYIAAAVLDNEILFFGASDEDGLLPIGSTINGSEVSTVAEAKAAIKTVGCLFLNGTEVSL
jgi:hypothetical protein